MGWIARLFGFESPREKMARLQNAAYKQGWYSGYIDGDENEIWKRSVIAFKKRNGLRARYLIGDVTTQYILEGAPKIKPNVKEPAFFKMARTFLGLREIKGKRHNAEILRWWQDIGASWFRDDETPYCGGFVGAMCKRAGYAILPKGQGARALAYSQNSKYFQKLSKPYLGCLVVFKRGKPGSGHVGFLAGFDRMGRPMILGANQSDEVNIKPFGTNRLVGFYSPVGFKGDRITPPIINSDGMKISKNEA